MKAFPDKPQGLLAQALVHPSYRAEAGGRDNQRLEFLGDAVLGLLAAKHFFAARPEAGEGELTDARSRLTREATLARAARGLGLGGKLRLGTGEAKQGGAEKDAILADAFEAVMAAVWLTEGMAGAEEAFEAWLLPYAPGAEEACDNPKGALQEALQKAGKEIPAYETVSVEGPTHARHWKIVVRCGGETLAEGEGGSKRVAEAAAARSALARFAQ